MRIKNAIRALYLATVNSWVMAENSEAAVLPDMWLPMPASRSFEVTQATS
jgi:hypothetical protein